MKTNITLLQSLSLVLCMLPAAAWSASPAAAKLDKHLRPIADAAERRAELPLKMQALARQDARLNTPFEARWNAEGQVQVYLHLTPGSTGPGLQALEALGATGILQSPELRVIQAWLPAGELRAAAELPGVSRVTLPRYALRKSAPAFGPLPKTGSVDTEGDQILGASSFRSQTGINGGGVTVGVISDGDDHISDSQKTGDLPASIWNDPKDAGGTGGFSAPSSGDEGTAMMEIVYDIAPGVKQLGFCGPQTTADFVTCLKDFSSDIGANVIVDDLAFPGGAMFTTDNFANAVQSFASANPKIQLVTATGNDATGYWQGTWQPMTVSTTVNGVSYTQAQNFNPSGTATPYIHIPAPVQGHTISYIVEWGDSWDDNSTTNDPNDYDVVVFDNPNGSSTGGTFHSAVACNQGINTSTAQPTSTTTCNQTNSGSLSTPGPTPVQGSSWVANGGDYYLEVFFKAGSPSTNLKILVFDQKSAQVTLIPGTPAGSIFGQSALPEPTEISVGAIDAASALSGSYNIESYSSEGPVETGTGASVNPQGIMKPDFVAPDCVTVTGVGGFGSPFCGTSAAAPHIAGLTALLMQAYPTQSPYSLLLQASTQPSTPNPNGIYGNGLPILTALLQAGNIPMPAASITAPTSSTSITAGQSTAFSGTCSAYKTVGNLTYDWNFGTNSGIADSSQQSPSVTFKNAGSYTVTLTCTGSNGSGTAQVSVTVKAAGGSSGGGGFTNLLSLLAWGLLVLRRRLAA